MTLLPAAAPRRALTLLLARYLAGDIADRQWNAFALAYDSVQMDAEGRAALATFCCDAFAELGSDARIPAPADVRALLPTLRGHA